MGAPRGLWTHGRRLDSMALAAAAGDRDARNALWLIVRPHLEKIAFGLGVRDNDVPDLVQDTLFSADSNLRRFDPRRGSFRTWLVTILIHLRNNLWRRRARRARVLEAMRGIVRQSATDRDRGTLTHLESALDLSRLFPTLSERQRAVLTLYVLGGLSARETGRLLGITAVGVRSIARDARHRLARMSNRLPDGGGVREV